MPVKAGASGPHETTSGAPSSHPSEQLSAEAYNSFVSELELLGIDVVRLSAERRRSGHAAQTRFDLTAGWQLETATILWRYDVTAHLTDPDNVDYGSVEASVVVACAATEASPACIEQFGATSGAMIAHPYLREAIAATALRLGFSGVLLPLVTQHPSGEPQTEGEV